MKKLSVTINGDKWLCRLMPDKEYRKKHGAGSHAITVYLHRKNFREIDFRSRVFCQSTVTHEVTHAFLSYFDFRRVTYSKMEEKFCDILGNKIHTISRISRRIYREFR